MAGDMYRRDLISITPQAVSQTWLLKHWIHQHVFGKHPARFESCCAYRHLPAVLKEGFLGSAHPMCHPLIAVPLFPCQLKQLTLHCHVKVLDWQVALRQLSEVLHDVVDMRGLVGGHDGVVRLKNEEKGIVKYYS